FLQPHRVPVEFQRGVEIAHAQHGVEKTHVFLLPGGLVGFGRSIAAKSGKGQGVSAGSTAGEGYNGSHSSMEKMCAPQTTTSQYCSTDCDHAIAGESTNQLD